MQLVVHLKGVDKVLVGEKKKIFNTKRFEVKSEEDGNRVLADLEKNGFHVSKHSFCGDTKSWGRPFKNQSK